MTSSPELIHLRYWTDSPPRRTGYRTFCGASFRFKEHSRVTTDHALVTCSQCMAKWEAVNPKPRLKEIR